MTDMAGVREKIIVLIVALCAWLPLAMLNAWAISTVWNWYLPPTIGAPTLSFASAFGLSALLSYFKYEPPEESSSARDVLIHGLARGSTKPFILVGTAWVYLAIWPLS